MLGPVPPPLRASLDNGHWEQLAGGDALCLPGFFLVRLVNTDGLFWCLADDVTMRTIGRCHLD